MTQSTNKPAIFAITEDGDWDKAIFLSDYSPTTFYPDGRIVWFGFSDGTLIKYQAESSGKIFVEKEGSAYISIEGNKGKSNSVHFKDEMLWIVMGELD